MEAVGRPNTFQEMAWNLGGKVDKCDHREYGFAQLQITKLGPGHESADRLFDGLEDLEV